MKKLIVAETFYSIQGEGQTMGKPSVFLRLGGCNLLCKSEDWVCDSIEVWQKGKAVLFSEVLQEDYIKRLREGAHLIITGGEPLIHKNKIIDYLEWFQREFRFKPIIEIETNGTINPEIILFETVNYWNVSPKLKNSGETAIRRINELALSAFNNNELKTIFKFVVNDREDFLEILEDYGNIIDIKKVVLMPAGSNTEELNKTRSIVAEMAIEFNVRYSERLHIVIWNQKTGV